MGVYMHTTSWRQGGAPPCSWQPTKAAWVVFVVILPWLGVLIYLIVEHDGMRVRSMK